MADFDPETIVLETVRRQTGKESAGLKSRFAEDLGLSDNGRRTLFAYMVETFTAKGQNLPARGFYLTDFLQCDTVGEVLDAIKATLAGTRKAARAGAKAAPAAAKSAPATATAPSPAPAPATKPVGGATSRPAPQQDKSAKAGSSSSAKKKSGGAKKSAKRR
jgi:hypothetical protein